MKSKTLLAIAILIIIAGAIMVATIGFNVDLKYQDTKQIEIGLETEYKMEDIRQITNEVFENKKVEIREVESFGTVVGIRVKEATEEEINLLLEKTNQKYGTENTTETIRVNDVPRLRIREMLIPYILPVAITVLVTLLYAWICTKKWKTMLQLLLEYIVIGGVYFSIIAITRIPINEITIIVAFMILIVYSFISIYCIEDRKKEVKKKEKKKK